MTKKTTRKQKQTSEKNTLEKQILGKNFQKKPLKNTFLNTFDIFFKKKKHCKKKWRENNSVKKTPLFEKKYYERKLYFA